MIKLHFIPVGGLAHKPFPAFVIYQQSGTETAWAVQRGSEVTHLVVGCVFQVLDDRGRVAVETYHATLADCFRQLAQSMDAYKLRGVPYETKTSS